MLGLKPTLPLPGCRYLEQIERRSDVIGHDRGTMHIEEWVEVVPALGNTNSSVSGRRKSLRDGPGGTGGAVSLQKCACNQVKSVEHFE